MSHTIELPPGFDFVPLHRVCPRCGLDLTQHLPESAAGQQEADGIEQQADSAGVSRVSAQLDESVADYLQRMVAPLTEAEKERAQRAERDWLRGQSRQQPSASQQEDSKAANHERLVPMVKRKLGKWILHIRKF